MISQICPGVVQGSLLSFSVIHVLEIVWNLLWAGSEQLVFHLQLKLKVKSIGICSGMPLNVFLLFLIIIYLGLSRNLLCSVSKQPTCNRNWKWIKKEWEYGLGCLRVVSSHFQIEFNCKSVGLYSGLPQNNFLSFLFSSRFTINQNLVWAASEQSPFIFNQIITTNRLESGLVAEQFPFILN